MTCLIPCPPVIFPGVFQPCAALKPWMGQCGSWEQMGHPYPEGLSSNFFYAATSPFPNIDAYNQHQALASSMACLLLDASHGVLKSTLVFMLPNILLHSGIMAGNSLSSWAAVQGRMSLIYKFTRPVFSSQLCQNIGLKLF